MAAPKGIDDAEVVSLFARGLTVDEVATELRCSDFVVRRILKRNLIETRMYRSWVDKTQHVIWKDVKEDYLGVELSVKALCKKHSIRVHDLYQFLARNPDIPRRSASGRIYKGMRAGRPAGAFGGKVQVLPDSTLDGAVDDYMNGVLVHDIEMTHRIGHRTLYKELRLRGLPLRGKREADRRRNEREKESKDSI